MSGLIKIGKTTTSPDKRMSELHSTGVPMPFVLEFSAEVEDCTASERAAHLALQEYRVSKSREFFRTSVRNALLAILPKIGEYTIHKFSSSHDIPEIKKEISKRKLAAEKIEAIKKEERERKFLDIKTKQEKARKDIEAAIANEKSKLVMLGRRPIEESDPIVLILSLAYFPVPIGWAVWIGTLQVFNSKSEEIGVFCIILLIVGYFANREHGRQYNTHMKKLEPYIIIERKISELEKQLQFEIDKYNY